MPTEANVCYGQQLGFSADGEEEFDANEYTDIPQSSDISLPKLTVTKVPVSNNDSPTFNNLGVHESLPGMVEPDQIKAKVVRNSTNYGMLFAIVGKNQAWRVTMADGSFYYAEGYLMELPQDGPMEGAYEMNIVVQCTGDPDFAPA